MKNRKKSKVDIKKKNFPQSVYYVGIILLPLIVYFQVSGFEFVNFDDHNIILGNYDRIDSFKDIPNAFTVSFANLYRPMLIFSFIVDAQFSGQNPGVYHVANLIYHIVFCLLLFVFLQKITGNINASFLATLIFSVHPLLVEAVAWVPGRNDTLIAIFAILSLLSFINYSEKNFNINLIFHGLFFGLALFTKETALLIPIAAILLNIVRSKEVNYKQFIYPALIWLGLIMVWYYLRSIALGDMKSTDVVGIAALLDNLWFIPALIGKIILPVNLSGTAVINNVNLVSGLVLIGLLITITFAFKNDRKVLLFSMLCFFMFLIPAFATRLEIAPDFYDYLEHRIYLPLAMLMILMTTILSRINVKISFLLSAGLIIILIIVNIKYTEEYSDKYEFWNHSIESAPERANFYNVLGKIYHDSGNDIKSKEYFRKAIDFSTVNKEQYLNNYSYVCLNLKDYNEELRANISLCEISPSNSDYLFRTGRAYFRLQKIPESKQYINKSLAIDSTNIDALIFLTGIYIDEKNSDSAIISSRRILDIDSGHYHANSILGELYYRSDKIELATKYLFRAIELKPANPIPYSLLGEIYLKIGDLQLAKSYYSKALERNGKIPKTILDRLGINIR